MEVATFYTMFNLDPVGKYFIQFCGTTPCALRGAGEIRKVLERRIGEERHVTADGMFSWLEVECLGACCNAPMVQINDDYFEDLTPENFEKLLDDLAAGRPVKTGSQIGRNASEPHEAVDDAHRPVPLRRLGDRRLAQALRGGGRQDHRYGRSGRGGREHAGRGQGRKASGRPCHRDRSRRHASRARQGRRGADQPGGAQRLRPTLRRRPPSSLGPKAQKPAPQSTKSYSATPSKPEDGKPGREPADDAERPARRLPRPRPVATGPSRSPMPCPAKTTSRPDRW